MRRQAEPSKTTATKLEIGMNDITSQKESRPFGIIMTLGVSCDGSAWQLGAFAFCNRRLA